MFDQGCSIPFIARYRRVETGGLKPEELRTFQAQLAELRTVQAQGKKLFLQLKQNGEVDKRLERRIAATKYLEDMSILVESYKISTNKSLAQKARDSGLGNVAQKFIDNEFVPSLQLFLDKKKEGLKTIDEIKDGVKSILIEKMWQSAELLMNVWNKVENTHLLLESSKAKATKAGKEFKEKEKVDESKFEGYLQFSQPVRSIKSHQTLALNRGEKMKVLSIKLKFPDWFQDFCEKEMIKIFKYSKNPHSIRSELMTESFKLCYTKKSKSAIELIIM